MARWAAGTVPQGHITHPTLTPPASSALDIHAPGTAVHRLDNGCTLPHDNRALQLQSRRQLCIIAREHEVMRQDRELLHLRGVRHSILQASKGCPESAAEHTVSTGCSAQGSRTFALYVDIASRICAIQVGSTAACAAVVQDDESAAASPSSSSVCERKKVSQKLSQAIRL